MPSADTEYPNRSAKIQKNGGTNQGTASGQVSMVKKSYNATLKSLLEFMNKEAAGFQVEVTQILEDSM